MQQQTSGSIQYHKLAIFCTLSTLFIVFIYESYIANVNKLVMTTDDSVTVANMNTLEYPINQTNTTNTTITTAIETCDCGLEILAPKFIRYGESTPLSVPETLPPIEGDIFDKINNNKVDNTLLVTIAQSIEGTSDDSNYIIYDVYNWIRLLEASNENKFLIFVLDERLYFHLIASGYEDKVVLVPETWYVYEQPANEANLDLVKPWILQRLLYTDANILYLDIHSILLKKRTREYLQTLINMRGDTKLIATRAGSHNQSIVSTDVMLFRRDVKPLKRLIANVIGLQYSYPHLTEQQAFNQALDQLDLHVKTGMLVLLDILHFPHHEDYFIKNLSKLKGVQPYVVQTSHKTNEERRTLLRKHKFWKVDEGSIDGVTRLVDDVMKRRYGDNDNERLAAKPVEDTS